MPDNGVTAAAFPHWAVAFRPRHVMPGASGVMPCARHPPATVGAHPLVTSERRRAVGAALFAVARASRSICRVSTIAVATMLNTRRLPASNAQSSAHSRP